jgi:hypothetical protein
MGFEFKTDQPDKKMVDNTTLLSANGTTTNTAIGYPPNSTITELSSGHTIPVTTVDENLVQDIFAEGEEERLAIQFLEECGLYTKFLLYCGIQEQLKSLKDSLETQTE